MKIGKRIFASAVSVALLLGLSACSDGGSKSEPAAEKQESVQQASAEDKPAVQQDAAAQEVSETEDTEKAEEVPAAAKVTFDSDTYEIPRLKGSVDIPKGYYVFGEDIDYTDQMCRDVDVDPERMKQAMPLLEGQTLVVPSDKPYNESNKIYIKVKDKRYDDITLSELDEAEARTWAAAIVNDFKVSDYELVEGNGLRYFTFNADQGLGNVFRYATILNGHMIYIYENTGAEMISDEDKAVLEFIALSVKHGL